MRFRSGCWMSRGRTTAVLLGLIWLGLGFLPAPAHAGTCSLTIVGGSDQLAIPDSRLSRPLRVRYDANGFGPSNIDVTFSNCEGQNILLDAVTPEGGLFDVTVPMVPDGDIVQLLGFFTPNDTPPEIAFLCVDIFDPDTNCFASIDFSLVVGDADLSTTEPSPVAYVNQIINLEVIRDPLPDEDVRVRWEMLGGSGSLNSTETLINALSGSSSNGFFSAIPGVATVQAWLAHPLGKLGGGKGSLQRGSVLFTINIIQRLLQIIDGDNQVGVVNEILPQPLTVLVQLDDGMGVSPEPGVAVDYYIKTDDTGGAVLVDPNTGVMLGMGDFATVVTNAQGEARAGLKLGPDPGFVLVCFNDAEGLGDGGCFNLEGMPGPPPDIVIVSGNHQTVDPGTAFAPLVVGTLPEGALSPGLPVNWQVVSGSASFDGSPNAVSEFGKDGTASINAQAGQTPGVVVIRATVLGFDPVDFSLGVNDPVVDEMVEISGNHQIAQPGQLFAQPLVVQILRDGVPLAGVPIRWQRILGIGSIEPDGSDRVDLISDSHGESSVLVRAPANPGTTRIRASADGIGAILFDLTATEDADPPPSEPVTLTLVSGDHQSGARGALASAPIVVRLVTTEEAPQPVVGHRIDWTVLSGAALLSAASSTTNIDGEASISFTYGVPGPIHIRAQATGSATAMVMVSATSFQPILEVATGDGQTGPISTLLPLPLVVSVGPSDTLAKGLAGISVSWTVVEGGGSLTSPTTLTTGDGTSSNALTLGPAPGIHRVRAEIDGSPPVFFTATAVGDMGVGTELVIISGDNQTLPTNLLSNPLIVELRDSAGNPVPHINLRWAPGPDSQIVVESEFTSTDAEGRASNRARALQPGRNFVRVFVPAEQITVQADFAINAGIIHTAGLSERERELASALDNVCTGLLGLGSPTSEQLDLILICRGLIDSAGDRPGEVRNALRQILPEEMLSAGRMGLQMSSAQFDNLKARLAALRGGVRGISFSGLTLGGDNGSMPLGFLDTLLFGAMQDDQIGADFSRWAFFMSGSFGGGERRITERETGFKFDNWNITGGVDYRYSDTLVLGAAAGYNKNETNLLGNPGWLESKGYSLSLYSTWYRESFYLDGVLTLGRNDFELERSFSFTLTGPTSVTVFNQAARSKTDGSQAALALSGGRDFTRGGWTFGPYLRGTLARQKVDGFTESALLPGAGSSLVFRVEDRTIKSHNMVLGGKLNYAISTHWGVLLPHVQVEYQREFQDDEQDIVVRLLHDPTATPFVLRGDPVDRNFLNIGLGLSAVFANGRSAFIFYERTRGLSHEKRENLALGLRFEF